MKRIALAIVFFLLATSAYAVKEYAQKFPTGTKLEVYTPNNPPASSGITDGSIYGVNRVGTNVILTNIRDNVGIGTSAPRDRLHVDVDNTMYGFLLTNTAGTARGLQFQAQRPAINFNNHWDGQQRPLGDGSSASLVLDADADSQYLNLFLWPYATQGTALATIAPKVRFQSDGNVGIGVGWLAAGSTLDVGGAVINHATPYGSAAVKGNLEVDGVTYIDGVIYGDGSGLRNVTATAVETDTLDSVVGRNSTTTKSISIGTATVTSGGVIISGGNIGVGTSTTLAGLTIGAGAKKTIPFNPTLNGSDALIKGNLQVDGIIYVDGALYGDGSHLTGISAGGANSTANAVPVSTGTALIDSGIYSVGGFVGIGTSVPSARFEIKAGTATSGTAPLKFNSGTLLSLPEIGAVEFLQNDYYATGTTSTTYVSQYPPSQDGTYVKSTTDLGTGYKPYFATDPTKSLTGSWTNNSWLAGEGWVINQRFHIDLGSAKIITRIYYENNHDNGGSTTSASKDFTFWGSNSSSDFNDLTYANNGTWTQLTTSQSLFDQHTGSNIADPKYITVTNSLGYRYYGFKISTNWGGTYYNGLRRVELQASAPARRKFIFDDGTTAGNLGIGTTIPNATLEVVGAGTTGATASINFHNASQTQSVVYLDNGNFGIGTTVPVQKLEVNGVVQVDAAIYLKSPDGTISACGPSNADAWTCTGL